MIGIDTNILLRYVVDDGSPQTSAAIRFVETELSETDPGYVSLPVLFEFVWTLRSAYAFSADSIRRALDGLLNVSQLEFEGRSLIGQALTDDAQLPDALIARLAIQRGCAHVVTFDKKFARLDGVELLV